MRLAGLGLVGAAACLLLAGCFREEAVQGAAVEEWGLVEPGDVNRVVEAAGVVKARDRALVRVGSRIGGQIVGLFVRSGQIVRQGQLLARIDDRELQTERDRAQARLERAQAELALVERSMPGRVEEQQARLDADRQTSAYARSTLERRKLLQAKGHIDHDQLEQATRDAATGDQTVAAGRAALERITREQAHEREKARQGVREAKAQLDLADARIAMTRIESPIDAVVGQIATQQGEQVVAEVETVTILTLIDPRSLELWIYINEADAAGVRPDMPVRFFQPSRRDLMLAARVSRVSPTSELLDGVRYYPALAALDMDLARQLRPEMNVQCLVLLDERRNVLSVPVEALRRVGEADVVYVDDGSGQGVAAPVRPGLRGNRRVEILEGVAPGTRVAVKIAAPPDRAGR